MSEGSLDMPLRYWTDELTGLIKTNSIEALITYLQCLIMTSSKCCKTVNVVLLFLNSYLALHIYYLFMQHFP